MNEAGRGPSRLATGLGASMPVSFALVSCSLLPLVLTGERFEHRIDQAGIWFWAVLGAAAFGAAVAAVLVFLSARGTRVPVALPIFVAGLPWFTGSAGTAAGMSGVRASLPDGESRPMVLAYDIAVAALASAMGTWIGAALLAGTGVGLAIAAIGQRAPLRSGLGAVVGVAAALPMLGIAVWAAIAMPPNGAMLVLPALGALVGVAIAGAAAGKDEPHRRSAALAAAAPVALGLAFVATAIMLHAGWLVRGFASLSATLQSSRGLVLAEMAEDGGPARLASTWGALAALAPVIGVGGWASIRGGASAGRIAGALAALLAAATLPAASFAVGSLVRETAQVAATMPWDGIDGFVPIVISGQDYLDAPELFLSPEGVSTPGDPPVPLSEETVVALRIHAALSSETRLAVAIDARVTGDALRSFVDLARAAGARVLSIVGTDGVAASERASLEQDAPMLASFAAWPSGVLVVLMEERETHYALDDPVLYHGVVTGPGPVLLATRAGSTVEAITLGGGAGDAPVTGAAYLAIGPDATAEQYVTAASLADRRGLAAVVVTGAIPGNPGSPHESDARDPSADPLFPLRNDPLAVLSRGELFVTEGFSEDRVERVMRRHHPRIQDCYQQELEAGAAPTGRVVLRFMIQPDGSVPDPTAGGVGIPVPASMLSCMETVARGITFPEREEGGVVFVSYPYTFPER